MIIELVIAMLACARIGAVHSIVVNYLHKILHVFSSYHHIYNLMSYIIFCKSKLFHNLNSILSFVFLSIFPLLQIACKQPPPPPLPTIISSNIQTSHFFSIKLFKLFVDYSHFLLNICIILKLRELCVLKYEYGNAQKLTEIYFTYRLGEGGYLLYFSDNLRLNFQTTTILAL